MAEAQSAGSAVRTIIVATDFSETAALALSCAKTLARAHSAQGPAGGISVRESCALRYLAKRRTMPSRYARQAGWAAAGS